MTLSRRDLLALGLPALAGCAAGRILPSAAAPDQLLVNGRIVTMDPRRPRAEAVALPDALSTIPVEGTMVGGRWVWRGS